MPNEQDKQVAPEYKLTKRRVITKRGVLWLGQTCNLRCQFCYFKNRIETNRHLEHPFMSIEKAKNICRTLVDVYNNNAVDIQGGEPTIYPDILELISYCRQIKLAPTLITNGLLLANEKKCISLKEAGVRDLLISMHGIGETYDHIVGNVKNASKRQIKGIENCNKFSIPIRMNCVLSKNVLPQLKEIAVFAKEHNFRVVNFIAFNPFEDQSKKGNRSTGNVPRYSEVSHFITDAMDFLEDAYIECNVRYFPICMLPERHRKSAYNFQQLSYDIHEWDFASWNWTGMKSQRMKWGNVAPVVSLEYFTYKEHSATKVLLSGFKRKIEEVVKPFPTLQLSLILLNRKIANLIRTKSHSERNVNINTKEMYADNAKMRAHSCNYCYSNKCNYCNIKNICDGFHGDYSTIFGTDEANPITSIPVISDPKYFIIDQSKIVEEEDYSWAL